MLTLMLVIALVAFTDYLWKIMEPTKAAQKAARALVDKNSFNMYMAEHPKTQIPEVFQEELSKESCKNENKDATS